MGLYETLQAEFCPQLDTSLLAAIIADYTVEDDTTIAPYQLETIRETLKILADQAQVLERQSEEMDAVEASVDSFSDISTTSPTTPELCNSTSSGSDASSSQYSFNSPLGFLREAFSDVPVQRLKQLLRTASGETLEVDMEKLVEYILNTEHIRELEERGLDGLEPSLLPSPSEGWETVVRSKPKSTPKLAMPTKKNVKGRTIKLVDIRQTQHALPSPAKRKGVQVDDVGMNVWAQVSSLSAYLAALLPPASETHFSSFFHSPTHSTPANALRAALAALPSTSCSTKHQTKSISPINQSSQDAETDPLFAIFDLLQALPTFATLDPEERKTLYADASLALAATRNKPDEAINVVWILWDLENPESGTGIYHLPPPNLNTAPTARVTLPTGPPLLQPPPTSKRKSSSSTTPTQSPTTLETPWNVVPIRSFRTTHPHEDLNPVYKRRVRGAGNGLGKGGKGDERELPHQGARGGLVARHMHFTRGMNQAREERGELLRQAGRAWRKPWGGEVALHYAQRAREVTERVRGEALDEARELIEARRDAAHDRRTIDLHGTCVREAIVITSEILEREGCSHASPLRLITGRGSHSVGGVGVLKPAVLGALKEDGWDVRKWDGGLVVQGRARGVL